MADVVVFDFECTIASQHLLGSIRKNADFKKVFEIHKNNWDQRSIDFLQTLDKRHKEVQEVRTAEKNTAELHKPCFSSDSTH